MGLILDTNILVEIERSNKEMREEIIVLVGQFGDDLYITSPTLCDFLHGVLNRNKDKISAIKFLDQYHLLNTSKSSSILFSELKHKLAKEGKMLSEMDLLIASICMAEGKTLVTMDEDFSKINGLNCVLLVG